MTTEDGVKKKTYPASLEETFLTSFKLWKISILNRPQLLGFLFSLHLDVRRSIDETFNFFSVLFSPVAYIIKLRTIVIPTLAM